ncbi:MAG: cytidine deaminase [Actinobacteria bacterium]|uniref:Unannotated protein n=1 Tax=freshwater metagenome TaxID=449393 RepID=A0A6J7NY41_9ZZZZ|nr:cytidine deaminase [Actinomycetota bacterium]
MTTTDPDEAKLVTLARGARSRVNAREGAALRDDTGRTYSAASVVLDSLRLSALELAVAVAVSSGARGVEAVVVCGDAEAAGEMLGIEAVRDLAGAGVPVLVVDIRGDELARIFT